MAKNKEPLEIALEYLSKWNDIKRADKKGGVGKVCDFGWFTKDTKEPNIFENSVCHSDVRCAFGPTLFFTSVKKRTTEAGSRTEPYLDLSPDQLFSDREIYLDWLYSPISPYSSLFKNFYGDRETWKELSGIIVTDTVVPSALLVNFFIATRTPYEYTGLVHVWNKLVKEGLNPAIAYYLCVTFRFTDREFTRFQSLYYDLGHLPLNFSSAWTHLGVEHFATASPIETNIRNKLHINSSYTPCNSIWYPNDLNSNETYVSFLKKTYVDKPKVEVTSNRLFKPKQTKEDHYANRVSVGVSYELLKEICIAEERRIFNKKVEKNAKAA